MTVDTPTRFSFHTDIIRRMMDAVMKDITDGSIEEDL